MNDDQLETEVFRAGDYGPKGVYTPDDLAAIAADYTANRHEAPVTVDHHQQGPAHGWVAGLRVVGDRLVASLRQLSPTLVEALRLGRFRKRSIELYRRFADTGRPYLKAVSFLGAAAPAVKGLADPLFHEEPHGGVATFEDTPPVPFDEARRRLIAAGSWQPAWEEAGLPDILARLDGPTADSLLTLLATIPAPVAFRELTPLAPQHDNPLVGIENPRSREHHERAVTLMAANPGLAYGDAIRRVVG
jgi:hypothetical protein